MTATLVTFPTEEKVEELLDTATEELTETADSFG